MSTWNRTQEIKSQISPELGISVSCALCGQYLPNMLEARIHLRQEHHFTPDDADVLAIEYPFAGKKKAESRWLIQLLRLLMEVIDPGREYLLGSYDGEQENRLVFMKREGEGYPFNVGHHAGTNCQEVLRALIARVQYLDRQIPCGENKTVIASLRKSLLCFELRAATRHGRILPSFAIEEIETQPICASCGHIGCEGIHHG